MGDLEQLDRIDVRRIRNKTTNDKHLNSFSLFHRGACVFIVYVAPFPVFVKHISKYYIMLNESIVRVIRMIKTLIVTIEITAIVGPLFFA